MVYVMAYDKSRRVNLSDLRNILFWSVIFSIWLSVLFAYFFSQRAIEPISRIIRSVKEISSSRLNNRLDEGNRKDEIAQLAMTFNQILTNLEISFKSQQDFVSNASHELRTPISVLISESDYVISRKRTSEEYVSHISGQIADLKKLNSLLNSLLELAQLNSDKTMAFTTVRVDEIVYNAIFQIKNKYHGRKIVPRIHYPENERLLNIKGNDGLLSIAFSNLLDNACKFSTEDVDVEFVISDDHIRIRISDKGIGIPADELKSGYTPFKRASNVKYIGGFGLGLSLVKKIFDLHDAEMRVQSSEDNGTLAEVIFKSFKNPE